MSKQNPKQNPKQSQSRPRETLSAEALAFISRRHEFEEEPPAPRLSGERFELFTDGSCWPNPGPGGWAFLLRNERGEELERSGFEESTTNNQMELTAIIRGLQAIENPSKVRVSSDSQYCVRGADEWLSLWESRDWKNSFGGPVKNRELWETIASLKKRHRASFRWVRGHNGHVENERVDASAEAARIRGAREASTRTHSMKNPCKNIPHGN